MSKSGKKFNRNLLTNRRFLLILGVVALVVIIMIFAIALGLSRKKSNNEDEEVAGVFYQRGNAIETVFTTSNGKCNLPSLDINLKIIEPLENKLIACGNVIPDELDYCWVLSEELTDWTMTGQTPLPIDDSLSLMRKNELYMFEYNTLYKFNEETEDWISEETELNRGVEGSCAVSVEDYVIITGGIGYEKKVHEIEMNNLTVTILPDIHFNRKYHGCIVLNFLERLSILVVGGDDQDSTSSKSIEFIWWDERDVLNNWYVLSELKVSRPFYPLVFLSAENDLIISGGTLKNETFEVEKISFAINGPEAGRDTKYINPKTVSRTIELPSGVEC